MTSRLAMIGQLLVNQFERLSLLAQAVGTGLGGGVLVALLHWATQDHADAGAPWNQQWVWMLAMLLLPLTAAAWPVLRASNALKNVVTASRKLIGDDNDQVQIPFETACDELHALTSAMRRDLEATRRVRHALQAQNASLSNKLQSRTQQLSTLQDLSIGLANEPEIAGLVNEALGALGTSMSYSSASIWARSGLEAGRPVLLTGYRSDQPEMQGLSLGDLTGLRLSRSNLQRYEQIERDGKPIVENRTKLGLLSMLWAMVTDDARTSALYRNTRSWMAVPLKVRQSVLGVLRIDHQETDYFDEERSRLLTAVAGQTALAMSHAHALALQRDSAVVNERNRIARELHDAVSQTLFAANLLAGALARSPDADQTTKGQAQVLERLNRSALAELRMMLYELRPDALAGVRLPELLQQAIEALSGRGGIDITTDINDAVPLETAQRIEVYRIAQAALSNIGRHSGATQARLSWQSTAQGPPTLTISDNGCGFEAEVDHPGHFGVSNIRERATTLGADLNLQSTPGNGTTITLTLNRREL